MSLDKGLARALKQKQKKYLSFVADSANQLQATGIQYQCLQGPHIGT